MPIFEVEKDGEIYEVDAPSMEVAASAFDTPQEPFSGDTPQSAMSTKDKLLNAAMTGAKGAGWLGKNLAQGAAALPGMVADVPANLADIVAAGLNKMGANIPATPSFMRPGQSFQEGMEQLNPMERTDAERLAGNIVQGLSGAGVGIAAGKAMQAVPALAEAGKVLAMAPKTQLAASATAPIGSDAVRQSGGGELAQMAGGTAAAMTVPIAGITTQSRLLARTPVLGRLTRNAVANDITRNELQSFAGPYRQAIIQRLQQTSPQFQPTVGEALADMPEATSLVALQKKIARIGSPDDAGSPAMKFNMRAAEQRRSLDKFSAGEKSKSLALKDQAIQAVEAANKAGNGLDPDSLIKTIVSIRDTPGVFERKGVASALDGVIDTIQRSVEKNGYLNAESAHAIRMNIGKDIRAAFTGKETPEKDFLAKIQKPIQEEIDRQMVAAGGTTWPDFLKTFSESRKTIKAETDKKAVYRKAASSANVDASHIAGPAGAAIPFNPLDARVAVFNAFIRRLGGNLEPPVTRSIADALLDPKQAADILSQTGDDALKRQFMAAALQSRGN